MLFEKPFRSRDRPDPDLAGRWPRREHVGAGTEIKHQPLCARRGRSRRPEEQIRRRTDNTGRGRTGSRDRPPPPPPSTRHGDWAVFNVPRAAGRRSQDSPERPFTPRVVDPFRRSAGHEQGRRRQASSSRTRAEQPVGPSSSRSSRLFREDDGWARRGTGGRRDGPSGSGRSPPQAAPPRDWRHNGGQTGKKHVRFS